MGDHIDLQMAPVVLLSQINPDRDKIPNSGNNFFSEEPEFSARAQYLHLQTLLILQQN